MYNNGPIVLALGGNALSPPGQEGNIEQQFAYTRQTATHLARLIADGCQLVLTHGNGPQVGNVLRRVELAAPEVYTLPLDICDADTEGGMGYMIAQCLNNELRRIGVDRTVHVLVTMVEVAADDPAFEKPTKPIGGHYDRPRADDFARRYGWKMVQVPKHGWRRVVPSPRPRAIVGIDLIRRLAREGELLITCGGGGVPVKRTAAGELLGVEAVIDKDRTAALLAAAIGARTFVIVTSVAQVKLDYGLLSERGLARLNVAEARQHLADGQFPPGSMGPKMEAAIEFLEGTAHPAARVLICSIDNLAAALAGQSGTLIER